MSLHSLLLSADLIIHVHLQRILEHLLVLIDALLRNLLVHQADGFTLGIGTLRTHTVHTILAILTVISFQYYTRIDIV